MYLYTSTQLNLITNKKTYRFSCLIACSFLFFVGSCKKEAKIQYQYLIRLLINLFNLKK